MKADRPGGAAENTHGAVPARRGSAGPVFSSSKKTVLAFAALLLLAAGIVIFFSSQARDRPRFSGGADPETLARQIIRDMTDEDTLAQVFMLGWKSEEPSEPSPLILDWIRRRNIGGVKIFGRNTGDTKKLAETVGVMQREAQAGLYGIPLFVATDQEGGMVRHVKGSTSETPGNMAIGASGFPRDAWLSGFYIGQELSVLGINMNFAPAVDLYTSRDSNLIGPRAFSDDPVQAGIFGAAFARGQEAAGIMPTAKHFPGHGGTESDSHGTLPPINVPFEVLWERELVPYRILKREGIPAVMSGHLAFPATPGRLEPASLSPWFLTTVLRGQIGFRGLIITDDLVMQGAMSGAGGSLPRAAKQALLAGNDIILLSETPALDDPVWTELLQSMQMEPAFRERVRDAALRVLTAKLDWLRRDNTPPFEPDPARVETELPSAEGAAFFQDLAARSVTVMYGNNNIPLRPENAGRVLLAVQNKYPEFRDAGKAAYPEGTSRRNWDHYYSFTRRGSLEDSMKDFLWFVRQADTVIICVADAEGAYFARALRGTGKKVIIFSVLNPVHVEEFSWADSVIALYSYSRESFIAGFSVLTGRIPAQGNRPWQRQQ